MSVLKDLIGQRFGRLVAICRDESKPSRNARWSCICDCGKSKTVAGHPLISGRTQSCGCLNRDIIKEVFTTHGMSKSPEWATWNRMKQRCYNPKTERYPAYGGRGIRVCDRWINSFENFYADIGPRPSSKHSIDRFPDNDGDYEPNNCRWATSKEQAYNTQRVILVEIDGVTKCFDDWIAHLGLNRSTIEYRRARGMSALEALTTPVKKYKPRS